MGLVKSGMNFKMEISWLGGQTDMKKFAYNVWCKEYTLEICLTTMLILSTGRK
jgi:hypothetical protein